MSIKGKPTLNGFGQGKECFLEFVDPNMEANAGLYCAAEAGQIAVITGTQILRDEFLNFGGKLAITSTNL